MVPTSVSHRDRSVKGSRVGSRNVTLAPKTLRLAAVVDVSRFPARHRRDLRHALPNESPEPTSRFLDLRWRRLAAEERNRRLLRRYADSPAVKHVGRKVHGLVEERDAASMVVENVERPELPERLLEVAQLHQRISPVRPRGGRPSPGRQ